MSTALDLGTRTIHRFHTQSVAKRVADAANRLVTGCSIGYTYDPVTESDANRGVGNYAVYADTRKGTVTCGESYRLGRVVDQALQMVLADEVAKLDPRNELLTTWHLKPENRDKCYRTKIEDDVI